MPIEIKELIIRAAVVDQVQREEREQQKPDEVKTQLVKECVEQVLEILRRKKER